MSQIFLFLIFIIFLLLWIAAFIYTNDLSIPSLNIKKYQGISKVMLIFPHPDDEAYSTVGLITKLSKSGRDITWLITTRGEKGTTDGKASRSLAKTRTEEANHVAKICDIKPPIFAEFPDGSIDRHQSEIKDFVKRLIILHKPDLVITYDQSGLYGHPDHITLSKIVTNLIFHDFPKISIWYTSLPKKQYEQIILPEHMAKDIDFKSFRRYPTHRLSIGYTGLINKIMAIYSYQSQFASFKNELPNKYIPLWIYMLPEIYEYYHVVR